jgi:hypothetical protein
VCVLVLAGCPVDDRQLLGMSGSDGQAGSPTELPSTELTPSGSSGGGPSSSEQDSAASGTPPLDVGAGAGAAPAQGSTLIDGCADLDGDGISDCEETRVVNAEFGSDVSGWSPDAEAGDSFTTTLTWDPENASGSDPSGSASVTVSGAVDFNGSVLRAATQCILVDSQQLVVVYANAFVDLGQDPAGGAEVDVYFFDASDCTGLATSSFSTPTPADAYLGTWLTLHAESLSGVATHSALIKLGVAKPFRSATFSARFDNVLLKVQSP